jgi:hypothetical protein
MSDVPPALFLSNRKYRSLIILRQSPRIQQYGHDCAGSEFCGQGFVVNARQTRRFGEWRHPHDPETSRTSAGAERDSLR